jgi:hypothetical protein
MSKCSEWVNKIPIKSNTISENNKNNVMFQNINETEEHTRKKGTPIIEGAKFKIFDDFDMHKKRDRFLKLGQFGEFVDIFNYIKQYLLCPFYKSDQIIDSGIQSVLSVFLLSGYDISLNVFPDNEDTEIMDLNDLIDPELLYTEGFNVGKKLKNAAKSTGSGVTTVANVTGATAAANTVASGVTTGANTVVSGTPSVANTVASGVTESVKIDKPNKKTDEVNKKTYEVNKKTDEIKEKITKDIKTYSYTIRKEIYAIIFMPLLIHITYNLYYMFFFKESKGFMNIEKDYYDPYLKPNSLVHFFLGIVIKPVSWLWYGLNSISTSKTIHQYSDTYPYVFYILLYVTLYFILKRYGQNILNFTSDLLFGNIHPFLGIVTFIMVIEYLMALGKETMTDWLDTLKMPLSGTIKWLIYWIIRLILTISLFSFGEISVVLYLCAYFYFAILISDEKDTFEIYSDIDNSIYEKIYKIYNPDCDSFSLFKIVLQFISKYSFIYLIEITLLILLCNGMFNYSSITNVNIQSFLYILNFTMMFVIGIWSFTKYFTFVKPLDEKFDILNMAINKMKEKTNQPQPLNTSETKM